MSERWNSTNFTDWDDFWSRDLVKNRKRHSAFITKATITKRGGNTFQNETIAFLHVTWYNDIITWSLDIQTLTFLRIQNRMSGYHSISSRGLIMLKLSSYSLYNCVDESSHSYRTRVLWLWNPDKWRASNYNFYKSFNELNLKDKKTQ